MEDKRTWNCSSKQLLRKTLLLTTIFCSFLGSSRRPLTTHSNVVAKKTLISTQFGPNSTLFGVGGEGSLVLVISLERSQPFLTSIVVINAKLLAAAAKKVQSVCRCTAVW